jgi:hypothetical protein
MAKRGEHAIKLPVFKRKIFGVALPPLDLEPFGLRFDAPRLKQLGRQIEPRNLRAGTSRWTRRIAGAARNVEHLRPSFDAGTRNHKFADFSNVLGKRGVLTCTPHLSLPGFEFIKLRNQALTPFGFCVSVVSAAQKI